MTCLLSITRQQYYTLSGRVKWMKSAIMLIDMAINEHTHLTHRHGRAIVSVAYFHPAQADKTVSRHL